MRLETRAEAKDLAALKTDVDGDVRAHGVAEPACDVGRVGDAVRRVPAVALAKDPVPALDPVGVERVRADERPRRDLPHRRVPAEVVDVGVRVDDHVDLAWVDTGAGQEGQDHVPWRLLDTGVDEERPLVAQQVLRERARPEDRLDAVDSGGDLHAVGATLVEGWERFQPRTERRARERRERRRP